MIFHVIDKQKQKLYFDENLVLVLFGAVHKSAGFPPNLQVLGLLGLRGL